MIAVRSDSLLFKLWRLQLEYGDKRGGCRAVARHVNSSDAAPMQVKPMDYRLQAVRLLLLLPLNVAGMALFFAGSLLIMWINETLRLMRWRCQPQLDKLAVVLFQRLFCIGVRAVATVIDRRRRGEPHADIYCANHVSFLDGFVLYGPLRWAFVALSANRSRPIVGYFMTLAGCFFVDREGGAGGAAAMIDWLRDGANREPACIFPEGVQSAGKHILHFRSSAFRAGRPVTPVVLRYPPYAATPRESVTLIRSLLTLLAHLWTPVMIELLPTHRPNDDELASPELFASNVADTIAAHLDVAVVDDYDYKQSMSFKIYNKRVDEGGAGSSTGLFT